MRVQLDFDCRIVVTFETLAGSEEGRGGGGEVEVEMKVKVNQKVKVGIAVAACARIHVGLKTAASLLPTASFKSS